MRVLQPYQIDSFKLMFRFVELFVGKIQCFEVAFCFGFTDWLFKHCLVLYLSLSDSLIEESDIRDFCDCRLFDI